MKKFMCEGRGRSIVYKGITIPHQLIFKQALQTYSQASLITSSPKSPFTHRKCQVKDKATNRTSAGLLSIPTASGTSIPNSYHSFHDALEYALFQLKEEWAPDLLSRASQGKYLNIQAQLVKAKNILELGTLGGLSHNMVG